VDLAVEFLRGGLPLMHIEQSAGSAVLPSRAMLALVDDTQAPCPACAPPIDRPVRLLGQGEDKTRVQPAA